MKTADSATLADDWDAARPSHSILFEYRRTISQIAGVMAILIQHYHSFGVV